MSEGINRVTLLGNLGADPELRYTQGGQAVLNLRLATTESYLDKDKVRRDRTDWHSVTVWGKRGEALSKFLSKGSSMLVEGSVRTSSYDDKEGNKRYKTEIVATNVVLTGGKRDGGGDDAGESGGAREVRSGQRGGGGGHGTSGSRGRDAAEPPDDFGYDGGNDGIPFVYIARGDRP